MIDPQRRAELRVQRDALRVAEQHQKHLEALRERQRLVEARDAGRRAAGETMTYSEIQTALGELQEIDSTHCGGWIRSRRNPSGFEPLDAERREFLRGVAEVAALL